jgi:mannose-6-phosphate isomerase-like protein (cupin superfamily)
MRRVVTGQTSDGKSVFVSDSEVDPITVSWAPGGAFFRVWGADTPVSLPTDGSPPAQMTYFPKEGGFRFSFVTLPPETMTAASGLNFEQMAAEMQEKLPGVIEHMDPEHPGMHTTDSIDFDVVMSGEIWLELDDGKEVLLKPGDCVVMNGARHAWHNRTSQPSTMMAVLIGAKRK